MRIPSCLPPRWHRADGPCAASQHWLSFICADDRCNGTLRMWLSSEPVRLTDGVGWYTSNMRCEWQLNGSGSGSGTIELLVSVMDVEYGADELHVYDGPS